MTGRAAAQPQYSRYNAIAGIVSLLKSPYKDGLRSEWRQANIVVGEISIGKSIEWFTSKWAKFPSGDTNRDGYHRQFLGINGDYNTGYQWIGAELYRRNHASQHTSPLC
ncbi:hypothetical protein J6590_033771 [Homalodisca vitripennis]|nr:hypothetical protein J6590_033771 [Homalodisca vitripennis]